MSMRILTRHIYLADLNPSFGSEIRKERPVLVIQSEASMRHTVIIVPLSSKELTNSTVEYRLKKDTDNNLYKDSIAILDQVRAIDQQRFIGEIGSISSHLYEDLLKQLNQLFDM